MPADWAPLAWLALLFLPLLVLEHWLSQHLQGLGLLISADPEAAVLLQYIVLLPGTILHELSHFVAAKLVGVKTKGMSLRPQAKRGGNVRFGAVTVGKSDPFRESWIGLAPLLAGSAAILLLARWRFGMEVLPALRPQVVVETVTSSLRTADALLWLYLIFAISNAMLPSESDRQPWGPVLLFLALAAALVYLTGLLPQIPVAVKRGFLAGVTYLALAFGVAVSVDIPVALLILALEKLSETLLHRHVEY